MFVLRSSTQLKSANKAGPSPSPPRKRMRGKMSPGHNTPTGLPKEKHTEEAPVEQGGAPGPKDPASVTDNGVTNEEEFLAGPSKEKHTEEAPVEQGGALGPKDPASVTDNGVTNEEEFLPKPFAVRDCPRGMRIRGARPLAPPSRAPPSLIGGALKYVRRKKRSEEPEVDPANIIVLSD